MVDTKFHDCLGRLVCMGNPETGQVECLYKGNKSSTVLSVGGVFIVERQEIITIIKRIDEHDFLVESRKIAA